MDFIEQDIPTFAEHDDEPEHVFVVFLINGESYALPVTVVTEIVRIQRLMDVVDLPQDVIGVLNIRGRIVPIVDLKVRFTDTFETQSPTSLAIILEVNDVLTGLLVESVLDVIRITPEMIQQSIGAKAGSGVGVLGVVNVEGKAVAVLEAAQLLGVAEGDLGQLAPSED